MRRTVLIGSATLLSGLSMGRTRAQQSSDAEAIKAANAAFYAALSARDIGAIERVWAHEAQVFNVFAVSRTPMIGWDAVRSGYEDLFRRFPELSVAMPEPSIRHDADDALVVGVETQRARLPSGEVTNAQPPATNVFAKRDGRWLVVHHHSSRPPQ